MLDADKKEFATIVSATLKTYRIEPDADVLRLWWGVLANYTMEEVRDGFTRFVSSKEAKFSVVPANIVESIELNKPDGRLGADEAWAVYPHDEYSSAVITNEIAEAMQVAPQLLNEGDKIAARMAFKDAYNRIVQKNKNEGIAPKWFPSLGHDKAGREEVLKQAVQLGRLTQDHAMSVLPLKVNHEITEVVGLLDNKAELTPEQMQKNKQRIAEIKAKLLSKQ